MKYKYHIFFIPIFLLSIIACDKKEEEPTIDPATGCTNCTPSLATTFLGFFKAGTYTAAAVAPNSPTITSRASVFFSTQATNVPSIANATTVNAVFFNTDTLKYTGSPYYYTNYLPLNLASQTWSVAGAGDVPSFTFKNLKEIPSYSSLSAWPDTVKKSIGFTFIIADLQNITAASVFISDGLSSPSVFSKAIGLGSDTVSFTVENLAAVNSSTSAIITLFMENAFAIKVDNKDFKMSNEKSYTKKVVIKN